jgi:hypothetical protein
MSCTFNNTLLERVLTLETNFSKQVRCRGRLQTVMKSKLILSLNVLPANFTNVKLIKRDI